MRLHPVMNERQVTYFRSLKNYHVLTFDGFSLNGNRGRRSASPLTHTWPTSPCNDREREREREREKERERRSLPLPILLTTIVVCLFLLATLVGRRPPPTNWQCHEALAIKQWK